jgi:hypothetical protein
MKIAYMFLTRGDVYQPKLWDSYFEGVPKNEYSVYCHPKFSRALLSKTLSGKAIKTAIPTNQGDITVVEATILLMREAIKDPENKYFCLCSESCIPVQTFPALKEMVTEVGKSWIGYELVNEEEPDRRYGQLRDPNFLPRDKFLKQAQWMCLERDAVEFFLSNDYIEPFRDMFAVDEHYFICSMVKGGYPIEEKVENRFTTHVKWSEEDAKRVPIGFKDGQLDYDWQIRPKTYHTLRAQELLTAREYGFLFMRKIAEDCVITP